MNIAACFSLENPKIRNRFHERRLKGKQNCKPALVVAGPVIIAHDVGFLCVLYIVGRAGPT